MEVSEPKCVNSILNTIRVNTLRLGSLHIVFENISILSSELIMMVFSYFLFAIRVKWILIQDIHSVFHLLILRHLLTKLNHFALLKYFPSIQYNIIFLIKVKS